MSTPNRNETFGRLLKAGIASIANCEGKTAPVVEDELGAMIGVAGKSIQRYKAGYLPPEARTVQILAEACVRRGFMNREWLQNFLHAARYPFAEKLLDELCPAPQVRPRPPRVYENLPAPTYSQFVMREQAFGEITDGLGKRTAVVLIVGLGGNGKTSLAREVAAQCLRDDEDVPRFDAVVWVSDKDRPGTTNLSTVLDEIARTLDYPGFTQFEHEEKRREVEQLLRRQRVLLVVDNFETITDDALLSWLINMPEPSKALITTREYRREFRRSGWPVELRGMSEGEAWELINERARALKIDRLISERIQMEPLFAATGGNPKAITMILGLLKYERRPLQQVVDDLYAARGEIFDNLFTRAWSLLNEAARRVLLVATFFPTSASGEALSASADVQGFAFDRAVESLTDLALLDVQQEDLSGPPRYALHPLVRAFAGARLAEQPGLEVEARQRWVGWYGDLVRRVGARWDSLSHLSVLNDEHEPIREVIHWAYQAGWYQQVIRIADDARYYYHIRGLWQSQIDVEIMRSEAAHRLGDVQGEIHALGSLIDVLCDQEDMEEVERYLPRLQALSPNLDPHEIAFALFHQSLFWYHYHKHNVADLQAICDNYFRYEAVLHPLARILGLQWVTISQHLQGNLEEAERVGLLALVLATQHNYERALIFTQYRLAEVYFDQGRLDEAMTCLVKGLDKAYIYQDRRYIARTQDHLARLHTLRGDIPAARAALAEAIDLFERLGMRRELAEARAELARLETPGALVGSAPGA